MRKKGKFTFYDLVWALSLPGLACYPKLKPFKPRIIPNSTQAEVLIQAASVGEAKMAVLLAQGLRTIWPELKILISTNTIQGKEIVLSKGEKHVFFPFDFSPTIRRFLDQINPKLVLVLETEIWPNFFRICKQKNIPILLLNARLRPRSLSRYLLFQSVLEPIGPSSIYSISPQDGKRFEFIFPQAQIKTMSNLKFELINPKGPIPYLKNPLNQFISPQLRLIVFGSIRTQEETDLLWVIEKYLKRHPKTALAIFPRHMERISAWQQHLSKRQINFVLRTKLSKKLAFGQVVLWDKIGELNFAYALAQKVFVGGSLAPLGGQNFLEPLEQGIKPIIGPSWFNFEWVGQDIFARNLVYPVENKEQLLAALEKVSPPKRDQTFKQFFNYLKEKKGGLDFVLGQIRPLLRNHSR